AVEGEEVHLESRSQALLLGELADLLHGGLQLRLQVEGGIVMAHGCHGRLTSMSEISQPDKPTPGGEGRIGQTCLTRNRTLPHGPPARRRLRLPAERPERPGTTRRARAAATAAGQGGWMTAGPQTTVEDRPVPTPAPAAGPVAARPAEVVSPREHDAYAPADGPGPAPAPARAPVAARPADVVAVLYHDGDAPAGASGPARSASGFLPATAAPYKLAFEAFEEHLAALAGAGRAAPPLGSMGDLAP